MATVKALVVAGGGGGGGHPGFGFQGYGGGGAGGLLYDAALVVTAGAKAVTVGAGGAENTNGADSVFESLTAVGGGGGQVGGGSTGGSGGGAGSQGGSGGAGTGGQGSAGGNGAADRGGGGGGAGAAGANAGANGGAGGAGSSNSISGSAVTYAGGGGGGGRGAYGAGAGGAGGGGAGGMEAAGTNGTANTGGGGGGPGDLGSTNFNAGSGGSGIVIISYATDGSDGVSASSTGGTITTSGGQTIHTFTSSGTFTVVLSATAPTDVTYTTPESLTQGTDPGTKSPTFSGSAITSASVTSGALPAGRTLQNDGTITGTPTTVGSGSYVITCTNAGGSDASNTVNWTVVAAAAPTLSYDDTDVEYIVGVAVTGPTPTLTGYGAVVTIVPDLPDGLSLNSATGAITGTPDAWVSSGGAFSYVAYRRKHRITAANSGGSVSVNVWIEVVYKYTATGTNPAGSSSSIVTTRQDAPPSNRGAHTPGGGGMSWYRRRFRALRNIITPVFRGPGDRR